MKIWPVVSVVALSVALAACRSPTPPKGVIPVTDFDASRYSGQWFEIMRLDNRFERGLEQVTASYQPQSDGSLRVTNRGYDVQNRRWKTSVGKALFTGQPNVGALKVSFFGPFYGGYNVIAVDEQYRYALVSGPNRRYLWLLSRTPEMPAEIRNHYLRLAKQLNFPVEQLISVPQGNLSLARTQEE